MGGELGYKDTGIQSRPRARPRRGARSGQRKKPPGTTTATTEDDGEDDKRHDDDGDDERAQRRDRRDDDTNSGGSRSCRGGVAGRKMRAALAPAQSLGKRHRPQGDTTGQDTLYNKSPTSRERLGMWSPG